MPVAGGKISRVPSPQLHLIGSESWIAGQTAIARPKSKLLFVLKPTVLMASRMHEDAARHAAGQQGRPAYPAELMHISLLCIDDTREPLDALVERTRAAAASIRARPIPITLDRTEMFGRQRHLVLCGGRQNDTVAQFARMLDGTLKRHNLPAFKPGKLNPHLTLVYDSGKIEPMPITRNYAWISAEFMLVRSHYGETRHEELGRWRFDPAAAAYAVNSEQMRLAV